MPVTNIAMKKVLACYILFIFALQSAVIFLPAQAGSVYLTPAIFLMGIGAIFCQKMFHRGKFLDMGFRVNRNAAVGLVIALIYVATVLFMHYWLPLRLGLMKFSLNTSFAVVGGQDRPILTTILLIIFLGGIPLFIAALFGEELAFRGYILPKFEEMLGSFKAIIVCAAVFSLWHLPAYFSIYSGGALERGWAGIIYMLLIHGITVIPICVLYLTTRELYGVSLIHALLDVFQYTIVGNPEMGEASKDAMYTIEVLGPVKLEVMSWIFYVVAIFVMLGLCRTAGRFFNIKI